MSTARTSVSFVPTSYQDLTFISCFPYAWYMFCAVQNSVTVSRFITNCFFPSPSAVLVNIFIVP
jgi:hypothetical protein